jgi:hypothetical protein
MTPLLALAVALGVSENIIERLKLDPSDDALLDEIKRELARLGVPITVRFMSGGWVFDSPGGAEGYVVVIRKSEDNALEVEAMEREETDPESDLVIFNHSWQTQDLIPLKMGLIDDNEELLWAYLSDDIPRIHELVEDIISRVDINYWLDREETQEWVDHGVFDGMLVEWIDYHDVDYGSERPDPPHEHYVTTFIANAEDLYNKIDPDVAYELIVERYPQVYGAYLREIYLGDRGQL